MDPKAIVIYDSDCGFCRVSLALLLSWDRRGALLPLPLGTEEADRLLEDLTEDERSASWHLILEEGDAPGLPGATPSPTRFSAGAAIAPALSSLPGGRIPAALFARYPPATERAYRWVADHRGLLGRFVPSRARRWADRVIAAHGGPEPSQ
jgi:predicted DCC family thiol-disulfide oxidoreductase YuxK